MIGQLGRQGPASTLRQQFPKMTQRPGTAQFVNLYILLFLNRVRHHRLPDPILLSADLQHRRRKEDQWGLERDRCLFRGPHVNRFNQLICYSSTNSKNGHLIH